MDETMNAGVKVTTDGSGAEEVSQEITIEETSGGPSKTFVGLVVGGIAAVAIGATVAWKRHKKKKAAKAQEAEEDFEDDEFYEEDFEDDPEGEEVVEEAAPETVEEPTEKKTGKK